VRAAHLSLLGACAGAALALGACGGSGPNSSDPGAFDAGRAMDDVAAQVEIGPRPAGSPAGAEEVRFIADSLEDAGVRDITVQRPYANVLGTLPGRGPGVVVVGAHHDTADLPGFVGANDGASGVAVLLELARALQTPLDGPSIQLAFFDAEETRGDRPFEEDGTRGSRQYVRYARDGGERGSAKLADIRAMVLFDLVGDCDLAIPREGNSDAGLYAEFAAAAGEGGPFAGTTTPILDDHIPFLEEGIPAVDLIDLEFGPGPAPGDYWHTDEDTLDKVCAESLDAVGEAAVEALPGIN